MADTFVKIRIGSEADLAALKAAGLEIRNVEQAAKSASGTLATFGQGLAAGGGIAITQTLAKIPGVLIDAAQRGLEFNATMQSSEVAIANVLQQSQGLNKEAALGAAKSAMADLKKEGVESTTTTANLVQGFLATLAASQQVGISVEDNIKLVGKFANALTNVKLPAEQLPQEMRAILTGRATESDLAKTIGISNEDIATARELGNVYEFLSKKLGNLGSAGDSFLVSSSTLADNLDQLLGTVTKPFFDELEAGVKAVNAAFADPKSQQAIQDFTGYVRTFIQVAKDINAGGNFVAGLLNDKLESARAAGAGLRERLGLPPVAKEEVLPVARETPKVISEASKALGQNAAEVEKTRKAWVALGEALSDANQDLEKAKDRFAESGQTPEAALQANIAKLNAVRADLAAQTGLDANSDASDFQSFGIAQNRQTVLDQTRILLDLNTAINAQAKEISATNAEALQAEDKRTAAARTFLGDLDAQLKIEQARVAGNDELVTNLEAQRSLAAELARIQSADLTPGEKERAADLTTQTAELQKQLALKQRLEALQAAERDLAIANAKGKGGQRGIDRAETAKLRAEKFNELRGLHGDDEARRLADGFAAADAKERLRNRGGFGNPVGSPLNDPANNIGAFGAQPSDDFLSLRRDMAARPIGELFGPPAPAGGAPGSESGAATEAGATQVQTGADQLQKAAGKLNQAGGALQSSGGELSNSAGALDNAAGSLDGAASDLQSASGALQGAVSGLKGSISDLKARVQALEADSGY